MGEACGVLGVPRSQLWGCTGEAFPVAHGQTYNRVHKVVSMISVTLRCSLLTPGCFSLSRALPWAHSSVFWMGPEKWASLAASHTAGEAKHSHVLMFPCRRNHWARRTLLALSSAPLWERWYVKSNISSYPPHRVVLVFFVSTMCWNISPGLLDFYKGSFVCGWLS